MRTAAFAATILLSLAACSTTPKKVKSAYDQPNDLMAVEISRRVEQIPYLHREELLENLLWLSQTGEQTIPSLLEALNNDSPKVRSSAAWVLGRLRDRRTIPQLQNALNDAEPTVRFEVARTLVVLGDLEPAPILIEGLDSERKEVRYLCHEALKSATGHDFGFDHLAMSQQDMRQSVLKWRQWWGDYSGDAAFAMTYERQHGLNQPEPMGQPAQPMGETQPQSGQQQSGQPQGSENPESDAGNPATGNESSAPSQPENENPGSATPPPTGSNQENPENESGIEVTPVPVVEIENTTPKAEGSQPQVVPVPIPIGEPSKPSGSGSKGNGSDGR